MRNTINNYQFRLVEPSDLQLLSIWLKEPMVACWYEDAEYIDDLEEKLEDSRIRMQLVFLNETPIAYVQDYDIHAWADHHLAFLPEHSRGIDTFIGSADLIGKGHGSRYLGLLATHLFDEGVPALGIDPNPKNLLARRAYQKIGFTEHGEVESEWGDVVLMYLFSPQSN